MADFLDYIWMWWVLLTLCTGAYFIYWFITNNDDYWDKRGVKNVKTGLPLFPIFYQTTTSERVRNIYESFSKLRYGGVFQLKQPILMIRDTELIHNILVKDFTYFPNQGHSSILNDPLFASLNMLKGQVWRTLRYKLTPTFSTGKLKGMFEQLAHCGDNMMNKIDELCKENSDLESKELMFTFTLDVISNCAFGFQLEPNSSAFQKFRRVVKNMFKPSFLLIGRFLFVLILPSKLRSVLKMRIIPNDMASYFMDITTNTKKYRKENNVVRNDYFQLLLSLQEQEEKGVDMGLSLADLSEDDLIIKQMKYTSKEGEAINTQVKLFTDEVICANSFIFLTAGSESVASTVCLTLFNLSQYPKIQEQLQEEVRSALIKHDGWSYDTIKTMTFLDQCIQETQRLYPVFPYILRECVQHYQVPDSDMVLEKGVRVMIPISALHRDPLYYPEPNLFKPQRFKDNNFKPNSTFLPFGDGPRICIAMRFAIMEVKTCVAKIMSQYTVKLGSKTKVPLQFDPRSFTPSVKGGLWLTFEKQHLP